MYHGKKLWNMLVGWLSAQTNRRYRLPTEAEWEFAARSGGKNQTWAGTSQEQELGDFAWSNANSKGGSRPVGSKRSNDLGLHDMSGNVWEWMQDCWHDNYNGAPTDGSAWEEKDSNGCARRVIRGGCASTSASFLRSTSRLWSNFDTRNYGIGFRLAQDIE